MKLIKIKSILALQVILFSAQAVAAGPWTYSCTVANANHNWRIFSVNFSQTAGAYFDYWIGSIGPIRVRHPLSLIIRGGSLSLK